MPEDKMVLLVEGQRPIFCRKLIYYALDPYKHAVDERLYPRVDVPEVELGPVPLGGQAIQVNEGSGTPTKQATATPKSSSKPPDRVAKAIKASPGSAKALAEELVTSSAQRLKRAVSASIAETPNMPVKTRKAIEEIWALTVPDPVEVGVEETAV